MDEALRLRIFDDCSFLSTDLTRRVDLLKYTEKQKIAVYMLVASTILHQLRQNSNENARLDSIVLWLGESAFDLLLQKDEKEDKNGKG